MLPILRRLALTIFCLLSAAGASAAEVHPALAAIFAQWERQLAATVTYESLNEDGPGQIRLRNLSISATQPANGPQTSVSVGEMVVSGIAEEGQGLWRIAKSDFRDVRIDITEASASDNLVIELAESSASDWYVMALPGNPTPRDHVRAGMQLARQVSTGPITFTGMGHRFISDGYEARWDGDPLTGAGTFSSHVKRVTVPPSALAAIDTDGQLRQLGYDSLAFALGFEGTVAFDGDLMSFDMQGAYDVNDAGALRLSMAAAGIPLAVYAELQAAQAIGREPNVDALMPHLMDATISRMRLRFEDASLTRRLLPLIARMQGLDEAALVANAGAMVQVGLMSLQNQAFTDMAVAAVSAYLKNPKSFTISIEPAAPVKIQELMSLNPAMPGAAIERLGISVTAND